MVLDAFLFLLLLICSGLLDGQGEDIPVHVHLHVFLVDARQVGLDLESLRSLRASTKLIKYEIPSPFLDFSKKDRCIARS